MSISHHPFHFPPRTNPSSPANVRLRAAVPAIHPTQIYKALIGSVSSHPVLCQQFFSAALPSSVDLFSVHVCQRFPSSLPTALEGLPTARSSAYSNLRRMSLVLAFLLITSTTAMDNSGLRALPCLRPTSTLNSSDIPSPHTTLPFVSSHVPSTILTSASGTPNHLIVAMAISLGTMSYAFSKSMNPRAIFSCPSSLFSTSCRRVNIPVMFLCRLNIHIYY